MNKNIVVLMLLGLMSYTEAVKIDNVNPISPNV